MFFRVHLTPITGLVTAGFLIVGFLACTTNSAQAGLCGTTISTNWTPTPPNGQTTTPDFESPDFVGCQTQSIFTGSTETVLFNGLIENDGFLFQVGTLDDDTLRLTAQSSNLDGSEDYIYPPLTLELTDMVWSGGQGSIVDVNFLGPSQFFEIAGFTEDSITFNFILSSIGVGIFDFPNLILVEDFDVVVVHAAVPEPGTLALLSLGLGGLAFARRKRIGSTRPEAIKTLHQHQVAAPSP